MTTPTVTIGAPLTAASGFRSQTATIISKLPRRPWTFVACSEETRGQATAAAAAVARVHQIRSCHSYKQNDIDSLDYDS
jgi:hypothetical protein